MKRGTQRSAASSGRPDERFPALTRSTFGEDREQVLISVVAHVNVTSGEGTIAFVNPLPEGRPRGTASESDVVLRVNGADGKVLVEQPVEVKLNSELGASEDREGLVDSVISVPSRAREIELVVRGRVVDTFRAVGPPPAVRAVQPIVPEGKELRIAVEHDRAMEPGHTYMAQISTDNGRTWETVAIGSKDRPSFDIDRALLHDDRDVQVRIITTNGFAASVVTSEPFRLSKRAV